MGDAASDTGCCTETLQLVRRLRTDLACPACERRYFPHREQREGPQLVAAEVPRESAVPRDSRISVVRAPAPEDTGRYQRLTQVDDPELVRVRGVLCELRPDRDGPLGWRADEAPPRVSDRTDEGRLVLGALSERVRVQTSSATPTTMPGAFARAGDASAGVLATARIYDLTPYDEATRATLLWLQREGTLESGLGALYRLVAAKFVHVDKQARWAVMPPRLAYEAQTQAGRKRVTRAADVWEGLITWASCGTCLGGDPSCAPCRGVGYVEKRAA